MGLRHWSQEHKLEPRLAGGRFTEADQARSFDCGSGDLFEGRRELIQGRPTKKIIELKNCSFEDFLAGNCFGAVNKDVVAKWT